jgi:hypothetical protein
MTGDAGSALPYCGHCRATYSLQDHHCPTCGSTLVLWKRSQEPEESAFRWWAVVNFTRVFEAWRRWKDRA